MKKILSLALTLIMATSILSVVPFSVEAATTPSGTYGTDYVNYGDVDINKTVDSSDALYILQHTVGKITLAAKKASIADVTLDTEVTTSDALTVLQFSVDKITGFTDEYYIDKVGGGTNGASADNIPDKYQKKVTFKISNGTWSGGGSSDIIQYKTLLKSGVYSTSGTASLSAPTGMTRAYGYTGGAWSATVPTSVSGTTAVTYTYSYSRMSVNYTIQHFKATTNAGYSSSPNATETGTGYVGDTVSGTAKTYTGYALDSSKSNTSMALKESGNTLKFYYGVNSSNYISSYTKSNSVNGAYVKDSTADTSFSVNIGTLKPYTMYRVNEAALKAEDPLYTWSSKMDLCDNDYMRLFYSLQGLINRDFGMDGKHTTMVYAAVQETDATWLDYIDEANSILKKSSSATVGDGLTQVTISTWDDLYAEFLGVIKACGIVLWDGNVPATANVAATICGLDGYLPVLAESPLHKQLIADGVTVKLNLVGMFKNGQKGTTITGTSVASTGSAKNDAYLWALEKYFSRCSSQYVAYMLDGACCVEGYDAYSKNQTTDYMEFDKWKQLYNHDYFIARRAFFFDLNPYAGEAASDDPAQKNGQAAVGTDLTTLKKILQKRYDRASGAFGQLIGFPPWWCKYSTESGLGSLPGTSLEWLFTELITCYNMAKEADAPAYTCMTNGSVYYKYVPKKSQYVSNKTPMESFGYDQNTFYYTIYVGDYDSSAWLKQYIPTYFADSKRGGLALMWSVNPNLSYRVPMTFDYMYEKKTAKDYFAGGDGGAGYIFPEALFHDNTLSYMGQKRPSSNAAAGTLWANYSKTFYKRFDLDMTGFIINGNHSSISKNIASSISQYSSRLNFTNCYSTPLVKYNNTYYVYCQNGVEPGQYDVMYNHAATYMNQGVNFSAYRTIALSPTQIFDLVIGFNSYAASKGMTARYLDPYTYYNVLHDSNIAVSLNSTKKTLVSFDTTANITTGFNTTAHQETSNKKQGSGCLNAQFENVTANVSNTYVGGMVYYKFTNTADFSSYDDFSLEYFLGQSVEGSAAIQINFVTNGQDDGFNYTIPIDGTVPGWHVVTMTKDAPVVNGADWSKINAIRITYFNYGLKSTPNFMLFDNLEGITYN